MCLRMFVCLFKVMDWAERPAFIGDLALKWFGCR